MSDKSNIEQAMERLKSERDGLRKQRDACMEALKDASAQLKLVLDDCHFRCDCIDAVKKAEAIIALCKEKGQQ